MGRVDPPVLKSTNQDHWIEPNPVMDIEPIRTFESPGLIANSKGSKWKVYLINGEIFNLESFICTLLIFGRKSFTGW